jgi:predicted CoA-binding protein
MTVDTESQLRAIYDATRTIAVVGATPNPDKPGHFIPSYLQSQGFRIIPVTPAHPEVLGETAYGSLREVPVPVDVVEVFRPAAEAPDIVTAAIEAGVPVVWLQPGIISPEAAQRGADAGIVVVMDRCMGVTHRELGLGPGP